MVMLYRIMSFYCLNLFFRFTPLHDSLLLVSAMYELRLIILLKFPPRLAPTATGRCSDVCLSPRLAPTPTGCCSDVCLSTEYELR